MSGAICLELYGSNGNNHNVAFRISPFAFFYIVQLVVLVVLNALSAMRARRAQKRWEESGYLEEAKPTPLLLPIYTRIMWLTCLCVGAGMAFSVANPYSVLVRNSTSAAVCEALAIALRQFPYDALCWCLLSQGAGSRSFTRALKWAGVMALVSASLRFMYVHSINDNYGSGEPASAVGFSVLANCLYAAFYYSVWLVPGFFRRPAARPYAAFWAVLFTMDVVCVELRFFRVDIAYCYSFVTNLVFYILAPLVLCNACASDSLYWQGALTVAARADLQLQRTALEASSPDNKRLDDVFSENPLAPTVAMTVAQADSLGIPLVNFNALSIDVERPEDVAAAAANADAPRQAPMTAPATRLRTLRADEARRAKRAAQAVAEASSDEGSSAPGREPKDESVILKLLGQGSFARVYKGTYRGSPVAIKLIYAMELTTDLVRNLYREAASLGALRSRYVVGVEGVCVMPPAVAMVMELCAGSLFNVIHGQGEAALSAIDAKVPEYEAARREQARATAEAKARWRLFGGLKNAAKKAATDASVHWPTEAEPCQTEAAAVPGDAADEVKADAGVSRSGDGDGDGADKEADAGLRRPAPRPTGVRARRTQCSSGRGSIAADDDDGCDDRRTDGDGDGDAVRLSQLPPDVAAALRAASTTPTGAASFCKPALSLRTQLRLALDCCAGVAFLHTRTRPVVHLDIKSGNFLVGRDGVIKVADMELSTRLLASEAVTAPMPASACRDQGGLANALSAAATSPAAAIEVGSVTGAVVAADLTGAGDTSSFGLAIFPPTAPSSAGGPASGPASVRPSPIIGPMRLAAAPSAADFLGGGYTPTHSLQAPGGSGASAVGAGALLLSAPHKYMHALPEEVGADGARLSDSAAPIDATGAAVGSRPPSVGPASASLLRGSEARGSVVPPRAAGGVRSRYLSFYGHPAFAPAWTRHGRVAALATAAAAVAAASGEECAAAAPAVASAGAPAAAMTSETSSAPAKMGSAHHSGALGLDELAAAAAAAEPLSPALSPALPRMKVDSTGAFVPLSVTGGAAPDGGADAAAAVPERVETLVAVSHSGSDPLTFPHGEWGPWPTPSLALAQLSATVRTAVLLLNRENRYSNLGADGFLVDEDGFVSPLEVVEPLSEPGSADSDLECTPAHGEAAVGFCGASRRAQRTRRSRGHSGDACSDEDCAESSGGGNIPSASLVASASLPFGMEFSEPALLQLSASDVGRLARVQFASAARSGPDAPAAALPHIGSDVSVTSLRDIALGAAANAAVAVGLCNNGVAVAAAAAAAAAAEDDAADDRDDEDDGGDGTERSPTKTGAQTMQSFPRLRLDRSRKAPVPPPPEPLEAVEPAPLVVVTASRSGNASSSFAESLSASASEPPVSGAVSKLALRSSRVAGDTLVPVTPRLPRPLARTSGTGDGSGSSNYVISTGGFRAAPASGERSALAQHLHGVRSCLGGYCTLACVSICFCPGCSPSGDARGGLCGGIADLTEQAHAGLELALDDSDDEHDGSGGSDSSSNATSSMSGSAAGCCSAAAASARRRARQTLRQRHERRLRRQLGKRRRALTIPETVNWLAPEFMRMEPFDTAADVYSLACVLWEIVAREVPFQELTDMLEAEERAANVAAEEARQARNAELRAELRRKREAEAVAESAGEGGGAGGVRHVVLDIAPERAASASDRQATTSLEVQEVVRQVQAAPASVRRVLELATNPTGTPAPAASGVSEVDVILAGAALDARTHATATAATGSSNVYGILQTMHLSGLGRGHSALGPAAAAGVALPSRRTGINVKVRTPIPSEESFPRVQTVPSRIISRAQSRAASSAGPQLAPPELAAAAQQRAQYTRDLLSISVAAKTEASPLALRSMSLLSAPGTRAFSMLGAKDDGAGVMLLRTAITRHATSVAAGSNEPAYDLQETSGGPLPPPSAPPEPEIAPEIELPVRVIAAPEPAAPSTARAAVQAEEEEPVLESAPTAASRRRPVTEVMRDLIAYGHYRPPVPAHTHPVLAELIIQGWHPEPSLRPTALEMHRRLLELDETLNKKDGETTALMALNP